MAGTISVVTTQVGLDAIKKLVLTWTVDGSGALSGNAITLSPCRLMQIQFAPGAGGAAPTDLYDVTLVDSLGADVLGGTGVNRASSGAFTFIADPPVLHQGTLDLVIANAGNGKSGTVVLYVSERNW